MYFPMKLGHGSEPWPGLRDCFDLIPLTLSLLILCRCGDKLSTIHRVEKGKLYLCVPAVIGEVLANGLLDGRL
jgi:hypothetical protein